MMLLVATTHTHTQTHTQTDRQTNRPHSTTKTHTKIIKINNLDLSEDQGLIYFNRLKPT